MVGSPSERLAAVGAGVVAVDDDGRGVRDFFDMGPPGDIIADGPRCRVRGRA